MSGLALQSLSIALPWLEHDGTASTAMVAPLLAAAMVGLLIGYTLVAPLAQTIGRRAMVTGGSLALSLSLAASAWATSAETLFAARVATGLAIGAITPASLTLLGETGSPRWRAGQIIIVYTAYPLGFSAAAGIGAWLIPRLGWPSLFALSSALGVMLACMLRLSLPAGSTAARAPRARTALNRLLREHRVITCVLWLVFVLGLGLFYALQGWLPMLARQSGASIDTALAATALFGIGAASAAVPIAALSRYLSLLPLLIASLMQAMIGMAALGLALRAGTVSLALASFAAGLGIGGVQKAGVAAATLLYPADLRLTGLAWTLGVGRLGAAVGPLLVGALLVQFHPGWAILALALPLIPLMLVIAVLHQPTGGDAQALADQAPPETR